MPSSMFAPEFCLRCQERAEVDEFGVCAECREDEREEEGDHEYRRSIGD